MFRTPVGFSHLAIMLCVAGCLPPQAPKPTSPAICVASCLPSQAPKPTSPAKWTIMVHMAADNAGYRSALDDLNEMEAGLNSPDINVIVLFDGQPAGDTAIYKIRRDPAGMNSQIISEKLEDEGAIVPSDTHEIDSGDAKVAASFIKWAVERYPAERYMVDFWGHGGAILDFSLPSKRFCIDGNGTSMKINDLIPLLSAGMRFELVGFDLASMSYVEVAYQLQDQANYLVASEGEEPVPGWDYAAWLLALSERPTMDGAGLGAAIGSAYVRSYLPGGSQYLLDRPQDVILATTNVPKLIRDLMPALNRLADQLVTAYPGQKAILDDLQSRAVAAGGRSRDLGDYLRQLQVGNLPVELSAAAAQAEVAVNQATIVNSVGEGGTLRESRSKGILIYSPDPSSLYSKAYGDPSLIAFAAERWKNFLQTTHPLP